jgi:hypothetical protein
MPTGKARLPYGFRIRRKNSIPAKPKTPNCTTIAPINQSGMPLSADGAGAGGLSGSGVLLGARVATIVIAVFSGLGLL